MKPLTLLVLTAVLVVTSLSNVLLAQVQNSEVKTNLPGNTFYFYFINGYALAYKFNNSVNSDLRLRIDFSSTYSDNKGKQDSEYKTLTPDKRASENSSTNSLSNVTAEFAYSYNFYRSHLGQAYAGSGPFVSYNRTKHESSGKDTYPANSGYNHSSTDLDYGYSAGLSAFIGLEAFLSQSVRIFAETQLTGGRNWSKSEFHSESFSQSGPSSTTSAQTGTNNSWFYNLTSVRIGLGISI